MIVLGVDIGKHKTKVAWNLGTISHLSKIATHREIKDTVHLDDQHLIIEYEGKKYLAGELAEREGQNFLNSPDIHKSNLVTLLNLLIALSKLPSQTFDIVIGNPFGINTQKEREALKELLIGTKEYKVNNKHYKTHVRNVGVCPEGLAAWYSYNVYDDCNILDFGSSTIHAIAIRKGRLMDRRSHTFNMGFENLVDHNYEGLVESIKTQMEKKWDDGDKKIVLIGGAAPDMLKYVISQYPKSNPTLHNNHEFANALGLYALGRVAYGQ